MSIYSPEPCYFAGMEGLKSHFLLIAIINDIYLLHNIKWETNISYKILMGDKYPLQNINSDENIVGP
jgi:hypothetical protein